MEYTELWAKVKKNLDEAMHYVGDLDLTQAKEYLDHNELGLAWESLAEVADVEGVMDGDFWRPMAKAAILMSESSYYHRT